MNFFVDTKSIFSKNFANSNYDYQYYPNLYQFNGYLEHGKATLIKKEYNCYFFNHEISNDKNDYIRIQMQRRKKQISYLKALKLYANSFILNNRSMIESTIKIKNSYLRVYNTHLIPGEMNQKKRILELTKILYILNREYNKGNYVILGGDFNFDLKLSNEPSSFPKQFKKSLIKNNWQLLTPHDPTYKNMIKTPNSNYEFRNLDGFITSPNIDIVNITNKNNWEFSDHSPIIAEFKAK